MTPNDAPKAPATVPAKPAAPANKQAEKKQPFELSNKNLRLVLLISAVGLVALFFIITLVGLSFLSGKSHSMVDLKVQSQTATNELLNLEQSKKDVEQYSYFKDVAKTVIPNDKDQAEAVLEIFQMADASGISIQSITFPTSTLGLTTSVATQAADATSSSSTKSALTQAKPVTDIPGLYSLQLTITPENGPKVPASRQITYPKMLDFLNRIENNRHTAQITEVDVQPPTATQGLSFSLVVNTFIKP
jgi:hypothetical protein